ncbi:MAG TPA: hypothetical protein VFV54_00230, partial [Thermoanaerobaculia bacterium]|nr:hypothetical protein [Thermoanaerobaculia bacterium]
MSLRTVIAATLFLLPLSGRAQTEQPRLSQMLDVTVANVEVIVTDQDGKRVRGLPRDAFELLENGVPQSITNFAEYGDVSPAAVRAGEVVPPDASEPTAEPVPPRRVVIFVDLKTTDMFQRKRVASSISGLLDSLGP